MTSTPGWSPGSSPRVRGKHRRCNSSKQDRGLIPACAGKTLPTAWTFAPRRAHPRVCGENRPSVPALRSTLGSSPRVRGKPGDRDPHPRADRLIPACAGKTCPPLHPRRRSRAHPRVCGENLISLGADLAATGSSPRVRGKRSQFVANYSYVGLIPACAGKTPEATMLKRSQQAHPRVCGENWRPRRQRAGHRGSSPRVRGKLPPVPRPPPPGRLIPACAGKTTSPPPSIRAKRAHPRVCGENKLRADRILRQAGSSPRVRGKQRHRPPAAHRRRLIPACAGKTEVAVGPAAHPRAHPRVCGENRRAPWFGRPSIGSSPRVRGKRLS